MENLGLLYSALWCAIGIIVAILVVAWLCYFKLKDALADLGRLKNRSVLMEDLLNKVDQILVWRLARDGFKIEKTKIWCPSWTVSTDENLRIGVRTMADHLLDERERALLAARFAPDLERIVKDANVQAMREYDREKESCLARRKK